MPNHVEAIWIDPFSRIPLISGIVDFSRLSQIYAALSDPRLGIKVTSFDCVKLSNNDVLYFDDEGLFKDYQARFSLGVLASHGVIITNRALLVGTGEHGNTVDPATSLIIAAQHYKLIG